MNRREDYEIETFEMGRDLWHARLRRLDRLPISIDGVAFDILNVGVAWPTAQAAAADALQLIKRMNVQPRSAIASHLAARKSQRL